MRFQQRHELETTINDGLKSTTTKQNLPLIRHDMYISVPALVGATTTD